MPWPTRPSSEEGSDASLTVGHIDSRSPSQLVKRKRDGGEHDHLPVKKAAKKKKSESSKSGGDEYLDLEQGLNTAIGNLDSRLLADYVAQREKRFGQDLSMVELEDRLIPGTPACELPDRATRCAAMF